MRRLLAFWAAVGVAFLLFSQHEHAAGRPDAVDVFILVTLGITFTLAAIVMLWGTAHWSLRALGLLGTVTGDAMLYGAAGVKALYPYTMPAWISDLVRATFIVGAPLLCYGLVRWIVDRRRGRDHHGL